MENTDLAHHESEQSRAAEAMPRYRCHKEVGALKIKQVELHAPIEPPGCASRGFATATITPAEAGYAPIEVDADYVNKHRPEAGGYFVVYADGYRSFSPAKAFEDGYTRA